MNSTKKNNQSERSVPGNNLGCVGISHVWTDCFFGALPDGQNYGACGIVVGSPNRFSSSGVVPLTAMSRNISMGLSVLCTAVLMMVMANAKFNLPLAIMLPKISSLSNIALRIYYPTLVRILCLLPTCTAFPHVKISNIKRLGNSLGLAQHRIQWVVS